MLFRKISSDPFLLLVVEPNHSTFWAQAAFLARDYPVYSFGLERRHTPFMYCKHHYTLQFWGSHLDLLKFISANPRGYMVLRSSLPVLVWL
jgi:hypothetical protein